jgi:signal transduction histidine kinase
MSKNRGLFYRSRSQLAIIYAGVMGATLLLCGGVVHFMLEKAFNRTIDRELKILALVFDHNFPSLLKEPEKFLPDIHRVLPNLCFVNQSCVKIQSKSAFFDLLNKGYYLRFLDKNGRAIAALNDDPQRFPANNNLHISYNISDHKGEMYHLHLEPLKTNQGEFWGYVEGGISLKKFNDYMNTLHLLLVVGVPLIMILIGGVSWYLAGLAMRPIEQSYAQMQRFTADVAHELRSPIASAQTILETSLENPLFSEYEQILQAIYRQVKRLSLLTTDLLFLSRLEQKSSQKLPLERICVNDLVQDVEEELSSMAIADHISLTCDLHTDKLLYIQGNEGQIYRLLINLVINAIKYTPKNGQVKIIVTFNHYQVFITVKDTGIGISSQDIPYIFERFYRVNDDRSRSTGGTGLGLAIAKAIAINHHGSLQVESIFGEGSSFTVILPVIMS